MSTSPSPVAETPSQLDVLMDVPVGLSAELGTCQLSMREVLQLGAGSVVKLDKSADAHLELSVNGKLFARGEVVIVENRFGIKITEIVGTRT